MKNAKGKRSVVATIIAITISLVMVYLIMLNYSDFSDTLISNEQKRLLAVADAIATSIEENVRSNEEYLTVIKEDTRFTEGVDQMIHGRIVDLEQVLERFIAVNSTGIIELSVYDAGYDLLSQYPKTTEHHMDAREQGELRRVTDNRHPLVGDTYFPEDGSPYYNIYMPVFKDTRFLGILRGRIDTEYIYEKIVKPVEIGIVGYASVKTNETVLLMHPATDDIGEKLMSVRRGRFPDYDWSELERVVDEQITKRRGVSIYHSVWAGDESGTRVKKFSAYSSADIGSNFWIVTISADYNQVVEVIRKNYYITLVISAMIFISVIFAMIFVLITRQKHRELEESISHNRALERLNKELAEDIEKRESLQVELNKSIKKYTAIFDNTKESVFIVDFEGGHTGKLIEQNLIASEVFGYSDDELRDVHLSDLEAEQNDDEVDQRFSSLEIGDSTLYETILIGKNGDKVPVEAQCSLFELDRRKRMLFIARDISQRKQEEQILIRSERRFMSIVNELATRMKDDSFEVDTMDYESTALMQQKLEKINIQLEHLFKNELDENRRKESLMLMQSKNAAMGEMIGNIAHQWRQPLNTLNFILTNMMDELDGCEIGDESRDYLSQKFRKGFAIILKMSETIDDFRHFFKPQDSKKEFELRKTIESTLQLFEERMKLYGIRVDVMNDEHVMYYGYSNHLSQVLLNLINNSIDAHREQSEEQPSAAADRKIEIGYHLVKGFIEITLTDNAGGIDESVIENIFDPYFTTKDMQNGTGLGLYMSKTIIEKHFGGALSVENINDGARFTIRLQHGTEEEA